MEKGKEHASSSTPPTAEHPTNPLTQAIESQLFPYLSNYMHGCNPPIPHAWSPPFVALPDSNPMTWTSQANPLPPIQSSDNPPIGEDSTSSSSSHAVELEKHNPDSTGNSMPTSSYHDHVELKQADQFGTGAENIVHTEGAEIVEEPKLGMVFESEEELLCYYKRYGQQSGFPIMTQRSHRFEDGSVRYVTLGCARGGKARNRTSNVARPRPTCKTDCKARINALFKKGVLKLSSVNNSHNHGLSPQKSRFFRCNREVSESVKRVLDINDQAFP